MRLYPEVTNFAEFAIKELNVGKKALWVRELIHELIHTEADFLELLYQIDRLAPNKIYFALKRMQRAKEAATYEEQVI